MTKFMYCITHSEMVPALESPGYPTIHLTQIGSPFDPDADWCEGPYATCPPPADPTDKDWDRLFADEDRIKAMLADFQNESNQPESLI